jgi:ribose-phosphate pyrophosphokinase
MERLSHEAIKDIFITDTVPFHGQHDRVTVLSVADLLAEAIRNVHDNGSVSSLFDT